MFHPPIHITQNISTGSNAAAEQARTEAADLRLDVERLLMITEALWGLVREKHALGEDELYKRIEEIDLRDGRLDGRVAPTPSALCPRCNRALMKKRPVCIYCGQVVQMDLFQR